MRDILKRIFIGVAIGMALFFLKTEVFALSWDLIPQGSDYFIFANSPKSVSLTINSSSTGYVVGSAIFDNNFKNTYNYEYFVIPYSATITNALYSDDDVVWELDDVVYRIVLISDGDWSTCELQNNLIICPLKPNLTYSQLRFYFAPGVLEYNYRVNILLPNAFSPFKSIFSSLPAIQQQTDDILDSDSPADATYNNDYSTSSFDSSSASVNQHTNTDVSSLNLDSSNYSSSWSWLWTTLESFIANTKVFLAYIFMLTLGFIALVLGR